jgi:hypothetical protein
LNITYFKNDRGIGDITLSYVFPILYSLVLNLTITVKLVFDVDIIQLGFSQDLKGQSLLDFYQLTSYVSHIQLISNVDDQLSWWWNSSGLFTVHSFYVRMVK